MTPPGHAREAGSATVASPATKADVLAALRGRLRHAVVPALVSFTVAAWRGRPDAVIRSILARLGGTRVAVRSSARDEAARPGHYRTCLDVGRDPLALRRALALVAASMDGDPRDQLLVQDMVLDAVASGVIVTADLATGAPYDVVEYDESGRTDGVTSGRARPTRIAVARTVRLGTLADPRLRPRLALARELERLWPGRPIEIEFAETRDGTLHVLQVRPATVARRFTARDGAALRTCWQALRGRIARRTGPDAALLGRTTVFGQMPDWNPAELIGPFPHPLARSLFDYLIGARVWRDARALLGYRRLRATPLLVALAGRPYVDVRASFNSFLPTGVPDDVGGALVDAWMEHLRARPELHDKVEFEVAETVADLDFEAEHRRRYGDLLGRRAREDYASRLRAVTRGLLAAPPASSLERALARIERAARAYRPHRREERATGWEAALGLLADCRRRDALAFAVVARHAFAAEALLRSAVRRDALSPARADAFRRSLATVGGQLARDLERVRRGTLARVRFMEAYGHLRPGTFDLTSPRYDRGSLPELEERAGPPGASTSGRGPRFAPTPREVRALDALLHAAGLGIDAHALLRYVARAVAGRERAKLLLSRRLSDALEILAGCGERAGLARVDLAFLTLHDLVAGRPLGAQIARRRGKRAALAHVRLGTLICGPEDVLVVRSDPTQPTFVGAGTTRAPVVRLAHDAPLAADVAGRIVCVESADPGFDWILARGPAGLVTRFGGANSHMAIRCTELAIPAALGVGDPLFERLAAAPAVELRCGEQIVRPFVEAPA